jgi:hypothetical protein
VNEFDFQQQQQQQQQQPPGCPWLTASLLYIRHKVLFLRGKGTGRINLTTSQSSASSPLPSSSFQIENTWHCCVKIGKGIYVRSLCITLIGTGVTRKLTKCVKEPVDFINIFQVYSNMFRQMVAIFRGS